MEKQSRGVVVIVVSVLISVSLFIGFSVHKPTHAQATNLQGAPLVTPMLNGSGAASTFYTCNAQMEMLPFYDYSGNQFYMCHTNVWVAQAKPYLTGTTGTITGTLLAVGGSDTGNVTITGAAVGANCQANASDGTAPATGTFVDCNVGSTNTVTVRVVAFVIGTPPSKTYSVKVFP